MISNCAGDQIEPAVKQAADAGAAVVSWDSPIPSGEGESVFVAQVDFDETGTVMADLALDILGDGGRRVRDPLGRARRREPERLDQGAQGGDQGPEVQEPQARRHRLRQRRLREVLRRGPRPGRQAPEPQADHGPDDRRHRRGGQGHDGREAVRQGQGVGARAAGGDEGRTRSAAARRSSRSGASRTSATWRSTRRTGSRTKQIEAEEGAEFEAGRLGEYTIEKDPTRDNGLRILMGPFTVYDKSNVEGG